MQHSLRPSPIDWLGVRKRQNVLPKPSRATAMFLNTATTLRDVGYSALTPPLLEDDDDSVVVAAAASASDPLQPAPRRRRKTTVTMAVAANSGDVGDAIIAGAAAAAAAPPKPAPRRRRKTTVTMAVAANARDVGDAVVADAAAAASASRKPAPRRRRKTKSTRVLSAATNSGDVGDAGVAGVTASAPPPPQLAPEMRPSTVWAVPSVADTTFPQTEADAMLASSTFAQERSARYQEGMQAQLDQGMSNRDILQRLESLLGSSNESDDVPSECTSESVLECNRGGRDTRRSSDQAAVITTDINMCQGEDQGILYTVLDSDASFDEETSGYEEDTMTQFSSAPWTVDALSVFTEEMGNSINDDDAILKLAKTRIEIKGWETSGWEQGLSKRFSTWLVACFTCD